VLAAVLFTFDRLVMKQALSAFVIALAVCSTCLASDSSQVQKIITAYHHALGDVSKLRNLRSWSVEGKLVSSDGSWKRTYRAWFEGNKARWELVLQPGIVATTWSDGTRGWTIQPWTQSLVPQPLDAPQLRQVSWFAQLWHNDLIAPSPRTRLEYLGTEELDGSDCFKLRAYRDDGSVATYYTDPDSGLLVKVEIESELAGNRVRWEATLGNYASVDGVMMPMELATSSGMILVERYRLDILLDQTLFAPPQENAR
jgi:outer membrane lipoprotein-sorting protein